jgi:hypothetical protein
MSHFRDTSPVFARLPVHQLHKYAVKVAYIVKPAFHRYLADRHIRIQKHAAALRDPAAVYVCDRRHMGH